MSRLLVFGLGYTAERLARRLAGEGWSVAGTARSTERANALRAAGFEAIVFDGQGPAPEIARALDSADHVLVSIAPPETGDPVLQHHLKELRSRAGALKWIGYLSTVGVYGDYGGEWVDEDALPRPVSARAQRRVIAEAAWQRFGAETGVPVAVFRIAGIYGPGRNQLVSLKAGKARRIVKPGQVFNRIHVDDLAATLEAAMALRASGIFNVADGHPAPPQKVVAFAADLMGTPPPPEVPFEKADMTPMARSFYGDNKRVANSRIREELGVELVYPDYRAGLKALYAAGDGK